LALKTNGTIWTWGLDFTGVNGLRSLGEFVSTPTQIGHDSDWDQISLGTIALALKRDGSLWSWGDPSTGPPGDPNVNAGRRPSMVSTNHDWQQISAGGGAFALRKGGTIWRLVGRSGGWSRFPEQVGNGTNWISIEATEIRDDGLFAIRSDGTLWGFGSAKTCVHEDANTDIDTGAPIGESTDWKDVWTVEGFGVCARKRDGSLWCNHDFWSANFAERIEASTGLMGRVPFDFPPWVFAVNPKTTCILTRDGRLWTVGTRLGSEGWEINAKIHKFFDLSAYTVDGSPHRIWEFPSRMRRELVKGQRAREALQN
jgi:alpha-tubulin suppressor-like RCC1 family protein